MKAKLMSNTKWRKLFEGLEQHAAPVVGYRWKFLDAELGAVEYGLPRASDLRESGLKDGRYQPIEFEDVEYLLIPKAVPDIRYNYRAEVPDIEQPIQAIESILRTLGAYPVETTEQGLVIKGYEL